MNQQRLASDFMSVTGTSKTTANKYLKANKYQLQPAINDYLNRQQDPKLTKIFGKYCDDDNDKIEVEGTIKYLEDLQIDPEDIRGLLLSYFLESPSMGVFTREKFLNNWQHEKIYTIDDMKQFIEQYYIKYKDFDEFQPIYDFVFEFLLEMPNQKLVNYELIIDYWKLMFAYIELPSDVTKRLDDWYQFVALQGTHLSKDSYVMWYQFLKEIIIPDPIGFNGYDEMSSWPSLIDEYVEWLVEQGKLSATLTDY